MSLKSLLERWNVHRVLPRAAALAVPAATSAPRASPRVLRQALPRQGATQRQMELDFRPGTLARALAPALAAAEKGHPG